MDDIFDKREFIPQYHVSLVEQLTEFLTTRRPQVLARIQKEKGLSDPLTAELKAAATEFKQTYK